MSNLKLLAAGLLLSLFIGCSSDEPPKPSFVEDAKAQMIGMSEQEAFTCMGLPEEKQGAGGSRNEMWSYTFGTCVVDLTLANGKVTGVKTGVTVVKDKHGKPLDEQPTMDEQCAHIPTVSSCVRWLRN